MTQQGTDDERLRQLERRVAESPFDATLRLELYREREKAGITDTIRPTLPTLPRRPACLGKFTLMTDRYLAMYGSGGRLRGLVKWTRWGDLVPGTFRRSMVRREDFSNRLSRILGADELNEVHRHVVALIGFTRTFEAWREWGVDPRDGRHEVCLGIAVQVACQAERDERQHWNMELKQRRKEEAARLRVSFDVSPGNNQEESSRRLVLLAEGKLELAATPTEYPPDSYEAAVLAELDVVRREKQARRLAGIPDPQDDDVAPHHPGRRERSECRAWVDRGVLGEITLEAGELDDETLDAMRPRNFFGRRRKP